MHPSRHTLHVCERVALTLFAALFSLFAGPSAAAQANSRPLRSLHLPSALNQSRAVSQLDGTTTMRLAIALPLRNTAELDAFLEQVSDPNSSSYKHYLTADEFTAKFGPTEEDYQKLIRFAEQKGLTVVGTHPNRLLLDVAGRSADVERAFNVRMQVYQHAARGQFFAPDREPSVDAEVEIEHVTGLDNFALPQPMGLSKAPLATNRPYTTGSGTAGLFIGKDFRAAYAPNVSLTGSGQAVALIEFDGFYASDVQKNFTASGLTPVPVQTVLLDNFNGAPGSANDEVTLDIMMAAYLAPGLSKVIAYEGEYPDDILNRIATDNLAKQISSSWGFGIDSTTELIFKQYIAQGQSFLQAAGDSAAYKGPVMTPSDDPNVTSVGGTNLSTSGAGGPWSSETAWSSGGGGKSTVYPIPSYQQGISMAASGGSTTMRNIPDVAAIAGVSIYLICDNGQLYSIGGTSAAAPLWAGFIALANQQAASTGKPPLGFLNPLLYKIGQGSSYTTDLHDVTQGSNGFSAVTGYDLATGWGSPTGQALINDLVSYSSSLFTLTASPASVSLPASKTASTAITVNAASGFSSAVAFTISGLPGGVTAGFSAVSGSKSTTLTLTASATAVPGTYTATVYGTSGSTQVGTPVQIVIPATGFGMTLSTTALTIQRNGGTAAATLSITNANGLSSPVSLSATSVPGVTLGFSPASTSAWSTLTFTTNATAVAGTYPIVITGTSGTLKSSATLSLTVAASGFTLSLSPTSLSVAAGSSAASTLSVTAQSGFTGTITLTTSGVPAGMTTGFSCSGASCKVVFAAASTLSPGPYTVKLTGTSGTITSSATILISVLPPPSFTLSASPTGFIVPIGGGNTTTIAVIGRNGFNSAVALGVSGMPAGMVAGFNAATSKITFAASAATVPGNYVVTVHGASGSLSASTTLQIYVPIPTFSLSASVPSLTLQAGGNQNGITAYVVGAYGFSSSVSFSLSGAPAGVTGSFSAPSSASSTTLILKAASNTVAGNYTLRLQGNSGSQSQSISIPLTITPAPSFSLSSSANSLALKTSGSTASSVITVQNPVALTGAVALSASGLPAGVTATLSPTSTTTTSTLTLKSAAGAKAGSYTITIAGNSSGCTKTLNIPLTISQ